MSIASSHNRYGRLVCATVASFLVGAVPVSAQSADTGTAVAITGTNGIWEAPRGNATYYQSLLPGKYLARDDYRAIAASKTGNMTLSWRQGNLKEAVFKAKDYCQSVSDGECSIIVEGLDSKVDPNLLFHAAATHIDLGRDRTSVVLGSENAPVTVVQYGAYTCENTKAFMSESLDSLKEYAAAGKIRLIWRPYPRSRMDLKIGQLMRCYDEKTFFDRLQAAFDNHNDWFYKDEVETTVEKLSEFLEARFGKPKSAECLVDEGVAFDLMASRYEGRRFFHIGRTPTLSVNGNIYHGYRETDALLQALDSSLASK